jgi:hypothetical protein
LSNIFSATDAGARMGAGRTSCGVPKSFHDGYR